MYRYWEAGRSTVGHILAHRRQVVATRQANKECQCKAESTASHKSPPPRAKNIERVEKFRTLMGDKDFPV